MAGQYTGLQKAYRIDGTNVNPTTTKNEIPLYRAVVGTNTGTVKLPTADNKMALGVVANDERLFDANGDGGDQTGRQIAVQLTGIANVTASDVVTAGNRVIVTTGGFIDNLPTAPGTYEVLGVAEKSGVAGDVIPVRLNIGQVTVA